MTQIFVGGDAEQPASRLEAGGKLEIREIGTPIAAAQPVLLLGEIVVADAGTVQRAQGLLGGTEIGDVAHGFGEMQRNAIDEAAHQRSPTGPQQLRPDLQAAGLGKGTALAPEQMARRKVGPPWHLVEPPQHRVDLAGVAAKVAALDRGKHIALEQHAIGPSRRQNSGVVFGQTHGGLTPPPGYAGRRQSIDRDRPAPGR